MSRIVARDGMGRLEGESAAGGTCVIRRWWWFVAGWEIRAVDDDGIVGYCGMGESDDGVIVEVRVLIYK